jgi:hypothetical protein
MWLLIPHHYRFHQCCSLALCRRRKYAVTFGCSRTGAFCQWPAGQLLRRYSAPQAEALSAPTQLLRFDRLRALMALEQNFQPHIIFYLQEPGLLITFLPNVLIVHLNPMQLLNRSLNLWGWSQRILDADATSLTWHRPKRCLCPTDSSTAMQTCSLSNTSLNFMFFFTTVHNTLLRSASSSRPVSGQTTSESHKPTISREIRLLAPSAPRLTNS